MPKCCICKKDLKKEELKRIDEIINNLKED